ncbi:hypothetical protein [Microbacterium allomyrinae]|uniref:Uncharacterized protein n=1 Tax=Microbacterium allomyrinae TaxID=2830666 RepID=A0A9X1S2V8_9MICO|nr:hypothetical protein [Microbacterium allomyrinae]MCC2031842.1 hypothetical protein [Microbacterium allomyrinae]
MSSNGSRTPEPPIDTLFFVGLLFLGGGAALLFFPGSLGDEFLWGMLALLIGVGILTARYFRRRAAFRSLLPPPNDD